MIKKLEKLMITLMVAGALSAGIGKLTNKNYLTYGGIGAGTLGAIYTILSSTKKYKCTIDEKNTRGTWN